MRRLSVKTCVARSTMSTLLPSSANSWEPRRWSATSAPLPPDSKLGVAQNVIAAIGNSSPKLLEPLLHHDFSYLCGPSSMNPDGQTGFKWNYLQNLERSAPLFGNRDVKVLRNWEGKDGSVVLEVDYTMELAMTVPEMKWTKGDVIRAVGTLIFDFPAGELLVTKLTQYECPYPPTKPGTTIKS